MAPRASPTFPSRVPVFSLDRIYIRGLRCVSTFVPRGTAWARMSDHLPLRRRADARRDRMPPESRAACAGRRRPCGAGAARAVQRRQPGRAAARRRRAVPGDARRDRGRASTRSGSRPTSSTTMRRRCAVLDALCAAAARGVRLRVVRRRLRLARDARPRCRRWLAAAGARAGRVPPAARLVELGSAGPAAPPAPEAVSRRRQRRLRRRHQPDRRPLRPAPRLEPGAAPRLRGAGAGPGARRRRPSAARALDARQHGPRLADRADRAGARRRAGAACAPAAARLAHRRHAAAARAAGAAVEALAPQRAAFVVRDNLRRRRTIERSYIDAIRRARERVDLVCPYFYPGHVFRRALRDAADRGVRVRLLMQGVWDYRTAALAARAVYASCSRTACASTNTRRPSCTPRSRWSTPTGRRSAARTSTRCRCCSTSRPT